MKLNRILLIPSILLIGLTSIASAQFGGPVKRTVFSQVTIDGIVTTQAVETSKTTDLSTGKITVQKKTKVVVPNGSGGFTKKVTEEKTVATPVPGETTFSVVKSTEEIDTPVESGEDETPTGEAESQGVDTDPEEIVEQANLDTVLPPVIIFVESDADLETTIVVSPT